MSDFWEFLMLLAAFAILIVIILIPITAIEYYSSCKEAKVYNKIYQTDWSCSDFFWAYEQINVQTQTFKIEL